MTSLRVDCLHMRNGKPRPPSLEVHEPNGEVTFSKKTKERLQALAHFWREGTALYLSNAEPLNNGAPKCDCLTCCRA